MTTTDPTIGFTRVVASFPTYREAEAAVDTLSDRGFAVDSVRIVGSGLKMIEHVTSRRGFGRAALSGAISGATLGVILGAFFAIFSPTDPLGSAVVLTAYGFLFGAVVGALFGVAAHAMTGGRRDFESIRSYVADRYDVEVLEEFADDALAILT